MVKDVPRGDRHIYTAHIFAGKNAYEKCWFYRLARYGRLRFMQRMVEERDFDAIRPVFFSTSQLGGLRRLLAEPLAHFRMPLIWRR